MRYLVPVGFLVFALILVAVPLTASNEYALRLFMLFLIYGMIAVGLNALVGLTGLVSLGQAGLFALGSYAGAILATRLGFDIVACCIGAAIVSGACGVLLAYPTVRVKGVYLAVVTIAFGIIVENVAIEWQSLTGGTTGLSSIPRPNVFGIKLSGYAFYAVLAVTLFILTLLIHNLKVSRYGRAMLAVSQSETASRALGINPTAMRTLAFVVASVTAGIAGTFYAFLNSYISPDIFTFSDSVRFLLMVILGGAGSTFGPVVGAYILTYLPEYLQQFQLWQKFAYGALLLLVMFVLPRGVLGTLRLAFDRLRPPEPVPDVAEGLPVETTLRHDKEITAELVANALTVRFGGLSALSNVSLRVKGGEIHALIGPNGAGKSTFVNTISGFYQPDEGRCEIDGVELTGRRSLEIARLGLARTFQNTELFGELSVLENVMAGYDQRLSYGLVHALLRTPRMLREESECRRVAIGLLSFVGLSQYANDAARFLPFGLQRRLEIARALAGRPRLLLLDEPAAGLTTQEIDDLEAMVRQIAGLGISVLLIEHHVDLIMALADTVTVLDYGQVIASDKPAAIQNDPRVIEAYFGTSLERAEAAETAA
ncbi:ABC transporter permease subunit [Bradyrhizobium erythrophlei]|uniref:Amino acid/amide ABC transporter membrane protein 2, HAAT family /amino acid/amide ABC transporter ATP-binding protein 1, HAAT family n=1 Tax=Bradyrhizobium erythrophlei TaxID=1437360 RepID=A0A1H4UMY7_9BRAD|nr:branched-chain amino acid ABC transporter ATP-binding protein/permease [Bradyrhizobium erythrophlei]SEC69758.1 amino acid/amide ABC transporter membrane protein 2, HAAT family /amino acid/amide ABC transporter ATP-binding protein 1, HAAT family [Bradyrhizobium erythrophlei]